MNHIAASDVQFNFTSNKLAWTTKNLTQKKGREETGTFMAEGLKLVIDALELGWTIRTLVYAKNAKGKALVESQPPLPNEAVRAIDARNAFIMSRLLQEITRAGTAARDWPAVRASARKLAALGCGWRDTSGLCGDAAARRDSRSGSTGRSGDSGVRASRPDQTGSPRSTSGRIVRRAAARPRRCTQRQNQCNPHRHNPAAIRGKETHVSIDPWGSKSGHAKAALRRTSAKSSPGAIF